MRPALIVIQNTVFDWWNSMVGLAITNIMWLLLSLTIIFFPPAIAGIYAVTHSMAKGTGQHPEDFLEGARRYAGVSYRWIFANFIVLTLVYSNIVFYSNNVESLFASIIIGIIALLTIVWVIMQFYVWPFLMIQTEKKLSLALKNALFLAIASPFYSLTILAFVSFIIFFSIVAIVPAIFFCMSFLALLGNLVVLERLSTYNKLPSKG